MALQLTWPNTGKRSVATLKGRDMMGFQWTPAVVLMHTLLPAAATPLSTAALVVECLRAASRPLPPAALSCGHVTASTHFTRRETGTQDLQGAEISGILIYNPPFESVREVEGRVVATGPCPDVVYVLARALNFSVKVVLADGNTGGILGTNGTWTGAIGMIVSGRAHLTMSAMIMTSDRRQQVDFIQLFPHRAALFMRTPGYWDVNWNAYQRPFTSTLWLAVAAAIILCACHLVVTARTPLGEAILFALGAFCGQGHPCNSCWSSGRIVLSTCSITAAVVLAAYSAVFLSFLAGQELTLPFSSLEDALNDDTYQMAVLRNGGMYSYFQDAKEKTLKAIYQRKLLPYKDELPHTMVQSVARACSKRFLILEAVLRVRSEPAPCHITEVPSTSLNFQTAIAFSKNSIYAEVFKRMICRMRSEGVLSNSKPTSRPLDYIPSPLMAIGIIDISPVLAVWVAGILISALLLLGEVGFWWWTHRK